MDLLHENEHLQCINHKRRKKPAIEKLFMTQNEQRDELPLVHELLFVTDGKLSYWSGENQEMTASKGEIVFFSSSHRYRLLATDLATCYIIRLHEKIVLYDQHFLDNLIRQTPKSKKPITCKERQCHLKINEMLWEYLNLLDKYYFADIKCGGLFETKIKELFYLFRAFYQKKELDTFFRPVQTGDSHFTQFIISNHNKYRTMTDMAYAMNYTVSGFEKHFKRVFEVSPYKWMKEQRAREIFHVISVGNNNFKEISEDFGFSSTSQFNDFVKGYFGKTPGEIRKNSTYGANME